jgi:hypothetical protein
LAIAIDYKRRKRGVGLWKRGRAKDRVEEKKKKRGVGNAKAR